MRADKGQPSSALMSERSVSKAGGTVGRRGNASEPVYIKSWRGIRKVQLLAERRGTLNRSSLDQNAVCFDLTRNSPLFLSSSSNDCRRIFSPFPFIEPPIREARKAYKKRARSTEESSSRVGLVLTHPRDKSSTWLFFCVYNSSFDFPAPSI